MGEIHNLQHQSQLVDAIKRNDSATLKSLYVSNYTKVELYVLKNSGSKDDAKDVYQEAFIAVWNNIKNNNFAPLNETALQGYIYTIAKNKWIDNVKSYRFKKTKSAFNDQLTNTKSEDINNLNDEELENKKLSLTMEAFKNLGQPCKQLLKIFYFEKKSLRDIALELEIDEASARNKKYRCMEKLRTLVLPQKT